MLPSSKNYIWGETTNPWNLSRTCGGSSGGEGALVAMDIVPCAIGSDVGGSVRIPATFCGVIGFKATPHRISKLGCMSTRPKNRHGLAITIPSVIGPLTRSVDDAAHVMKALWCEEHFSADPTVPPFAFRDEVFGDNSKLKIGYFTTDDWFEPCEAASRGLRETLEGLRAAGHELVEFKLTPEMNGWETFRIYAGLAAAEGDMRGFYEGLEGEELLPEYGTLVLAATLPNFLRPLIRPFLDARRRALADGSRRGGVSTYEFLAALRRRHRISKDLGDGVSRRRRRRDRPRRTSPPGPAPGARKGPAVRVLVHAPRKPPSLAFGRRSSHDCEGERADVRGFVASGRPKGFLGPQGSRVDGGVCGDAVERRRTCAPVPRRDVFARDARGREGSGLQRKARGLF